MSALTFNSYNKYLNDLEVLERKNEVEYEKDIYGENNLIMLRAVERTKSGKNFYCSAFCLKKEKKPNLLSTSKTFSTKLPTKEFYETYDVAEVLRGDYTKLFFDIDAHDRDQEEYEALKAFEQIEEMVEIIRKTGVNCKLCGIVEYNTESVDEEFVEELNNRFEKYKDDEIEVEELATENKNGTIYVVPSSVLVGKSVSAHLFVCGCYFSRDSLHDLFKDFNAAAKIQNSYFASVFDFTVFKTGQQLLRFALSGKAMVKRPANPNYDNKFCSSIFYQINNFVATKTDTDNVLICGETLEKLKTYINSMKFVESSDEMKKKIKNKTNGIEEDLMNKKPRILFSNQTAWYYDLCRMIAYDVLENKYIKDDELVEKYDVENHYYFSNSQQRRVRNVCAIKSAVKLVREKEPFGFCKSFTVDKNLRLFKEDVFRFSLEEFKKRCIHGVNIQTLAILFNGTFCFFNRSDSYKRSTEFIAYLNSENEITVDSIPRFLKDMNMNGFRVKLNRDVEGVSLSVRIEIQKVFSYCQSFRNEVDDFDVCTLTPNVLNLYNKPVKVNEYVELRDEWKTIFEAFATELNGSLEHVVNFEKYEYILNWFAFMLQHPESRNKTILYIAGKGGIGKNVLSNAIVKIIGKEFANGSADLENVCGNFTGSIENKKFVVINEVESSNYSDKIKKIIDDNVKIEKKCENAYITENKCNFIIYSNHLNTNIMQKGDRRFAFINSTAIPEEKEFYASLFDGDEYKPEILENLFNHLLSRDLKGYKNNEAPMFDKQKIYDDMDLKRSPAYLEAVEIMKEGGNKPIELNELVEKLNDRKDENEELRMMNITIRTIRKILCFNDTDDFKIVKNRSDDKLYLVNRYYRSSTSKEAMIEIMKKRNNERLEVNEAIKELEKVGMNGITTRTLRKTLNFTEEDKYEIKKSNGKCYVVYKQSSDDE